MNEFNHGEAWQPLGALSTRIGGAVHHEAKLWPGAEVRLVREPDNPHDGRAVAVHTDFGGRAGYLRRHVVRWLASLLDRHLVQVRARVPRLIEGQQELPVDMPLEVEIALTAAGRELIVPDRRARDGKELVHQWLTGLWLEMSGAADDTAPIEQLETIFTGLKSHALLPESRMLLALAPQRARVLRRRAMETQAHRGAQEQLQAAQLGTPIRHQRITVYPIVTPNGHERPYVLLDEALHEGSAEVRELGEGGSVPTLLVINRGKRSIVAPEGMVIIALKQNRVINQTVCIPPDAIYAMPVSCVEQGRWNMSGAAPTVGMTAPPSLRSRKMRSVYRNREHGVRETSDQGEVWSDVQECLMDVGSSSPTSSLSDAYAASEEGLAKYRERVSIPEQAVGILTALDGKLVGLELFDSPRSMAHCWQRCADSYFFEAVRRDAAKARRKAEDQAGGERDGEHDGEEAGEEAGAPSEVAAQWYLNRVSELVQPGTESTDHSVAIEIRDEELTGSGVWLEGKLRHLTALVVAK